MNEFLSSCWSVMLNLAPWLLLGSVVAAVMHVALPRDFIRHQLKGFWGVLKAVLIGVPLPLCSCGVIPAGMGLKKDGASDGACVGFLISTPQTGVDSILVSAAFLGWPFAIFKVVSAAITGWLGGVLTHVYQDDRFVAGKNDVASDLVSQKRNFRVAYEHGVTLIRSIWRWLVFGVIASAAIEVLIPESTMAGFAALGVVESTLVVLLISVPLYVCATSSVPIAAALVAGGMPMGMALVFLMAGPATNVATIGVIYRGFGRRALFIYLGVIVIGSTLLGWAFDFLGQAQTSAVEMHEHHAWWAVASAVLLCVLFVWFALEELLAWRKSRLMDAISSDQKRSFDVGGMTCGGCVSRLERVLLEVPDIDSVSITLEPGRAVVVGAASASEVKEAICNAGFEVR